MAKFDLSEFGADSSGKISPNPGTSSKKSRLNGTIIYEESPLRVMRCGTNWYEFIVYNYIDLPEGDNRSLRFGQSFPNQQLAQRSFNSLKTNKTRTVEI
jgi:hypothetical protein